MLYSFISLLAGAWQAAGGQGLKEPKVADKPFNWNPEAIEMIICQRQCPGMWAQPFFLHHHAMHMLRSPFCGPCHCQPPIWREGAWESVCVCERERDSDKRGSTNWSRNIPQQHNSHHIMSPLNLTYNHNTSIYTDTSTVHDSSHPIIYTSLYIHWVYKTLGTPFVGAWILQGVERVPQGCWLMLTPILPTVVSSWLDVLWVVDHSCHTWNILSVKNPAGLQIFTHSNLCAWHLLPYPIQRHLNILSCPFTLWMTNIHNCLKA